MKFHTHFIFRSPLNPTKGKPDDSTFSEALYLSTPVLHEEYQKHLIKAVENPKELKKLNISLYKYQTRASNRCTPFGLFAGLSIGKWDDQSHISIHADLKQTLNRKTRLDMNVLCLLAQELAKEPYIKPYLKFYPNTSIYLIGNSYRYVEYYYHNNRRFHKINRVDFTSYLEYILTQSKTGLTQTQLAGLLVSDEVTETEALEFIDELISSQLLINQLEPTVTGDDYFNVLLLNLKEIYNSHQSTELKDHIALLEKIDSCIKANDVSIFNPIESYKHILSQLKNILPELNETNLFQTDLYKKPVTNTLSTKIQEELKKTIKFLNKINPPTSNPKLIEFKKRFYDRYEDNEIPMLVALDTETGVGYPSINNNGVNELVEDIHVASKNEFTEIKWNQLQSCLLKLITDSLKNDQKIIKIDETNFDNLDLSTENFPLTSSVMFKVIDSQTNKIAFENFGGSSAINLLGRFANNNSDLVRIVEEIAQYEASGSKDKILAEIVHLPESRTGNILARPSFRKYEIPYLAKSSVSSEFQVKPENLMLKIINDTIILFDKITQKEIIPYLGNAHNFSFNSLPVYHFLCDLQTQHFSKSQLGFNWGVLSNQFNFLPRVEYQNCILSPAKWQLIKSDLDPFMDKKKTDAEKHTLFFNLKHKIQLPDKFLVAEGDNELLINCNDPVAIDTFIDLVKNKNSISLEEYLFDTNDTALIKDTDGNSYTNECIAIIFNEPELKSNHTFNLQKEFKNKQFYSTGSEWLYYKIYCGSKMADYILTEKLLNITDSLTDKKIIDKWFFIRYADPEVHLRFRLHISDLKKLGEVIQLINEELEPLLTQYIISKLQTDTYKRELERYGDCCINLAEDLFCNDSIFIAKMLSLMDPDTGGTIRWQMALRSVDEFLNDFKMTLDEKYHLINNLNNVFSKEHGDEKNLKTVLDTKFRALRPLVEEVLNSPKDPEKEYYPLIQLINDRSQGNKAIIQQLFELKAGNLLEISFSRLIGSLLHMNLDRLFMGRNRTNEFVVYNLLSRHYKGILARSKKMDQVTY